jgi:uncharacterized protein
MTRRIWSGLIAAVACLGCASRPKAAAVPSCPKDFRLEGYVRAQAIRCEWGLKEQCAFVGSAYMSGLWVSRDRAQARRYYQRACELGSQDHCVESTVLSLELRQNVRVPDVLAVWEKACAAGSAYGCHTLGIALAVDAYELGLQLDMLRGRSYLAKACAARYLPACGWEAALVVKLQEKSGYSAAHSQLLDACRRQERESCYFLATMDFAGTFAAVDEVAARRNLARSCSLGWGNACAALAWFNDEGIGGEQSSANARALARQSCELLEHKPSCDALRTGDYKPLAP